MVVGSDGSSLRGLAKVVTLSLGARVETSTFDDKSLESVVSLDGLGLQVIGGLLRTFLTAVDDRASLQVLSVYDNWATGIMGVFSDCFATADQLVLVSERDVKLFGASLPRTSGPGPQPTTSVSKEDNIFFEEDLRSGKYPEERRLLSAKELGGKSSGGSGPNHGSDRLSTASEARFDLAFESSTSRSIQLADPELSSDIRRLVFQFSQQRVVLVCADGLRLLGLDSRGSPDLEASKGFTSRLA